ncbi:hypothetical protein Lalb_Chr16g0387061 [Lupinus albus]|uniref:Uncharacterized protein n=1 Tax=Lupinus albus TaxID=3870 RepID=A0A6A4P6R5_LUPAL|nr:hypothetical protein Lalb_Chr16g0387061 [Lupinus albus]
MYSRMFSLPVCVWRERNENGKPKSQLKRIFHDLKSFLYIYYPPETNSQRDPLRYKYSGLITRLAISLYSMVYSHIFTHYYQFHKECCVSCFFFFVLFHVFYILLQQLSHIVTFICLPFVPPFVLLVSNHLTIQIYNVRMCLILLI